MPDFEDHVPPFFGGKFGWWRRRDSRFAHDDLRRQTALADAARLVAEQQGVDSMDSFVDATR